MRLAAILLTALLALAACGTSSEAPEPDDSLASEALGPMAPPAPDETEVPIEEMTPDPVDLWAMCSDYASGEVEGDWSFPYPDDAKRKGHGDRWKITGTARGPMDQDFTLSCSYADVSPEDGSATLVDYALS